MDRTGGTTPQMDVCKPAEVRGLSTLQLHLLALVAANQTNINEAGGPSWSYHFIQDNQLSISEQHNCDLQSGTTYISSS